MNRREFLRRFAISSALAAATITGVIVLAQKLTPVSTPNPGGGGTTTTQSSQSTQGSSSDAPSGTTTTALRSSGSQSNVSNGTTTNSSTSGTTITNSGAPSGYIYLAPLSAVQGKSYVYFKHPTFGSSILLDYNGTWKAFSAICTHAGCVVTFPGNSIYCNCHAGYFSPVNGAVTGGPPPRKLNEYGVLIVNSALYVSNSVVN